MDFKAIVFAIAGVIVATIVMTKLGMATHSSPFTVATTAKDKMLVKKMSTPSPVGVKSSTAYVI